MSFYLPLIDATDQHNWQRYNIALDEKALVDALACLEAKATDQWSFREINNSPSKPTLFNRIYAFFFRNACDIVFLREFDASKRRALFP